MNKIPAVSVKRFPLPVLLILNRIIVRASVFSRNFSVKRYAFFECTNIIPDVKSGGLFRGLCGLFLCGGNGGRVCFCFRFCGLCGLFCGLFGFNPGAGLFRGLFPPGLPKFRDNLFIFPASADGKQNSVASFRFEINSRRRAVRDIGNATGQRLNNCNQIFRVDKYATVQQIRLFAGRSFAAIGSNPGFKLCNRRQRHFFNRVFNRLCKSSINIKIVFNVCKAGKIVYKADRFITVYRAIMPAALKDPGKLRPGLRIPKKLFYSVQDGFPAVFRFCLFRKRGQQRGGGSVKGDCPGAFRVSLRGLDCLFCLFNRLFRVSMFSNQGRQHFNFLFRCHCLFFLSIL